MIFTLNVLLGNMSVKAVVIRKSRQQLTISWLERRSLRCWQNPDVKLPKPTAQRIDLVAPQFKYIAAGGGVVQSIIDAVLNQTPYPVKGWLCPDTTLSKP